MVETNEQKKTVLAQASEDAMVVDTMGGRVHVRWDETAKPRRTDRSCSSPNSCPLGQIGLPTPPPALSTHG